MEDKHILDHGLFVERGKGSKNEITAWSPRLEKAIADAKLLRPKGPMRLSSRPLFANKTGGPVSKTGFDSAWQRVREQFPRPNEVKDMSDKKEWQGPQDGLPPVGDWVMSPGGAKMFYVGTSSIGGHVFELEGGGLTVVDSVDGFSQIPNERDKWIFDAQKHCTEFSGNQIGKLYDALKSGSLKAPEVE